MSPPHITVIGIGPAPTSLSELPAEAQAAVRRAQVFSGGKRHYELVRSWLPQSHTWIMIEGDMAALLARYAQLETPLVVFASGDPLFFGVANTIRRGLPDAPLQVYAHHHALQLLSHRLLLDYGAMRTLSLHGRTWHALDYALLKQAPLIGILTDAAHSPKRIARRLLRYGFDTYTMFVGETLGGETERVHEVSLAQAVGLEVAPLNCVILERTRTLELPLGIPDERFVGLPGRPKMITKMPIRLLSLQALKLHAAQVFWDIGYCTGSVSTEAKRQFPHLNVHAFEKRPECEPLLQRNAEALHAPGIEPQADFFEVAHALPRPDSVFIGGHGGRLEEMLRTLHGLLSPTGCIVMNAVSEPSRLTFETLTRQLGYAVSQMRAHIDQHNPITIMKAERP